MEEAKNMNGKLLLLRVLPIAITVSVVVASLVMRIQGGWSWCDYM